MRKYIQPEITISLFDEEILASEPSGTLSPLSAPTMGTNVDDFLKKNEAKAAKRNYDFNNVIKFN